jgi:hypothetical protein
MKTVARIGIACFVASAPISHFVHVLLNIKSYGIVLQAVVNW